MNSNITQQTIKTSNNETLWGAQTVSKIETFLGERPFFGSFLLASIFVLSILVVFNVCFQLCDDIYSLLLLKGTVLNWAPSEFNFQENIILCLFLKSLYIHFPDTQWYSYYFVFAHFLSIWGILAAFNLGTHRFFRNFIFIIGSIVVVERFFIPLQWTTVASVSAISGFLLLAAIWRREDSQFLRPALCLSFVLIMNSILIRTNTLFLIALTMIPVVVYLSRKIKINYKRQAILVFLVLTSGLSLSAITFDHSYYFRGQAWEKPLTLFQECRESIFRNPIYDENTKPFFDSIGWSANDLSLFKNNYLMDQNTYSVEKLHRLNDYFPQFTFDKNPQDTFGSMFSNPFTVIELVYFLGILLFIPTEAFWFIFLYACWTFLVLLFCRLYLWMPERIYIPCFFLQNNIAVFLSVPKFISSGENSNKASLAFKWGAAFLTLFFMFSVFALFIDYSDNRHWVSQEIELKDSIGQLNPKDDQIFVTWGSSFPYINIGAFDNDEFLQSFHVVSLDWFQRTPTTQAMMDHFGLKDVFKDLVDNPKAFLICEPDQWNLYQVYMKEKYNMDIKFQFYFRSNQFVVLSVRS